MIGNRMLSLSPKELWYTHNFLIDEEFKVHPVKLQPIRIIDAEFTSKDYIVILFEIEKLMVFSLKTMDVSSEYEFKELRFGKSLAVDRSKNYLMIAIDEIEGVSDNTSISICWYSIIKEPSKPDKLELKASLKME